MPNANPLHSCTIHFPNGATRGPFLTLMEAVTQALHDLVGMIEIKYPDHIFIVDHHTEEILGNLTRKCGGRFEIVIHGFV